MQLNSLKPAAGARRQRRRLGRGIGSGLGKTAGRGHKGQWARSGGFHKVGFEGGQMPLQRRLPKRGFTSRKRIAEVRLSELDRLGAEQVDLAALKAAGIVEPLATAAKVILAGSISRRVQLTGIGVTKGARAAIEAAGGSVAQPAAPEGAPADKAKKALAKKGEPRARAKKD